MIIATFYMQIFVSLSGKDTCRTEVKIILCIYLYNVLRNLQQLCIYFILTVSVMMVHHATDWEQRTYTYLSVTMTGLIP